jgi:hypothetical protein
VIPPQAVPGAIGLPFHRVLPVRAVGRPTPSGARRLARL